jgi:hypothetical protein
MARLAFLSKQIATRGDICGIFPERAFLPFFRGRNAVIQKPGGDTRLKRGRFGSSRRETGQRS